MAALSGLNKTLLMNKIFKPQLMLLAAAAAVTLTSCHDDDNNTPRSDEGAYVGKAVGNFAASEWLPGGELGTTDNVGSNAFSDEAPVVDNNKEHFDLFFQGEQIMERQYTVNTGAFKGLGPASVRRSCFDCHPNYGHGKFFQQYTTKYANGNGYLLAIYKASPDPDNSDGLSNDGDFIKEVTGMPQTQAVEPFKAPIEESGIHFSWPTLGTNEAKNDVWPQHMKDGYFAYPDGTAMPKLQYPEVHIDQDAFNTNPKPTNYAVRIETTIGLQGVGLIDAIPEDSIKAQYEKEYRYFVSAGLDPAEYINSTFYNGSTFGSLYAVGNGQYADGTKTVKGQSTALKRYSYALTRAVLADANGANAVWNIPNVSRPDRPNLYTTDAWAKAMSLDNGVIAKIKADPTSPYYGDGTTDSIRACVYNLLRPGTNQFDNPWHSFTPEMSADQFYAFMVWHRGLAIPRARNLNDPDVQRGKTLFNEWGCASCHRAKWQTTDDNYWMPEMLAGKTLPQFKNQTIYPYSDFVQHKLYMKNDVHGSWCRTTPLWGRGLEYSNTGAEDRMHDCRARNEEEAILWHMYNKKSHAYHSALNFYNAPKADRDAVIKFLQSI